MSKLKSGYYFYMEQYVLFHEGWKQKKKTYVNSRSREDFTNPLKIDSCYQKYCYYHKSITNISGSSSKYEYQK